MARKSSAVSAASPVVTPKTFTLQIPLEAVIYTDKAGRTFTGQQCLDLLKGDVLKAVGYAASRKATLARDHSRAASGAPASRIYASGNLPAEAAQIAQAFREAVAAIVPTMAPKAPPVPKAAPVAALEDAVAATLAAPTIEAVKAAKKEEVQALKAARKAAKVAPAPKVVPPAPEAPKAAPKAPKARKVKATHVPAEVQASTGLPAVVEHKAAPAPEAAPAATGSGILTNDEVTAFLKAHPTAKLTDLRAAFPGRALPALNRFVALKAAAKA